MDADRRSLIGAQIVEIIVLGCTYLITNVINNVFATEIGFPVVSLAAAIT